MSKSMYCPNCSAYVGDCGHVLGGLTGPSTLTGTCGKCEREYTVTCDGNCLGKKNKEKKDGFVSSLYLSADGRAIVDDQGRELAKLQKGFSICYPQKDGGRKLPGHMVCTKECIAWNSNGVCVKYTTSCTWEFPPFDF